MLSDMLTRHLVTMFLIFLFSIMLRNRKSSRDTEQRYFWVTVLSCLVLAFEDSLEAIASMDPSLRFWRTLLSVVGYTFRSVAALGLLLVIVPQRRRNFTLWIPSLVTLLVNLTAFFTDAAFGFDENYAFYRGPLGYVAFIVPVFYMLLILWITFTRFTESKGLQKYIIPGGVVFCMAAAIADSLHGGIRLNEAIMICSILFYYTLHAHDNRRDPLTWLLNRKAFYDDCEMYTANVTAAASLDMNGLKRMNDTMGHHAGDEALVRIAECMKAVSNRDTMVYRVGGDEFVILFFHQQEETVADAVRQIRKSVSEAGYSISAGYAIRERGEGLEETIQKSDSLMYEDKANYYRANGRDRRNRR